jgi:hypothetical protein
LNASSLTGLPVTRDSSIPKVPAVTTTRAEIIRSRRPFRLFYEVGDGGLFLRFSAGGAPSVSLRTRARRSRLRQRIIISFVQALDFATAEALIPDLKPCAEGFGCVSPQRHNGAPQPQWRNGDTRCGYPSGVWRGTVQQERCVVVKGRHATVNLLRDRSVALQRP